jgi:Domain of unknown function (DUF4390)
MRRRSLLSALLTAPIWLGAALPGRARAQTVDLAALALRRDEGALMLEFQVRMSLSRPVEDALQRGVPMYFVAEAEVFRRRWYWRDDRIARTRRIWRLAYQPLTATWRVSLGALAQTYDTQADALAALSGAGRWRIADLADLDPDSRHYVEFGYRLDTTQLPSPMQIGLTGQADWVMRVERELNVPGG